MNIYFDKRYGCQQGACFYAGRRASHQLFVRYFSFVQAESSLFNFLFLISTFVILLG